MYCILAHIHVYTTWSGPHYVRMHVHVHVQQLLYVCIMHVHCKYMYMYSATITVFKLASIPGVTGGERSFDSE